MKIELTIDDQVRVFTLVPGEAFELPEQTLQEIETELLFQEGKALNKQLKLNDVYATETTVTPIEYTDEEIEEMRKFFNE